MPGLPNSLLLIVLLMAIFIGSANAIFDAILVNYAGHVYCNVSTANGISKTTEDSLVLPVQNVSMKLMEWDGLYFTSRGASVGLTDFDDQLDTCRTEADGSFHLTGSEWEIDGLEPYLIVKACRTDNPSICSAKKPIFLEDSNGDRKMVEKNAEIFLDKEFCQQICKSKVCESA